MEQRISKDNHVARGDYTKTGKQLFKPLRRHAVQRDMQLVHDPRAHHAPNRFPQQLAASLAHRRQFHATPFTQTAVAKFPHQKTVRQRGTLHRSCLPALAGWCHQRNNAFEQDIIKGDDAILTKFRTFKLLEPIDPFGVEFFVVPFDFVHLCCFIIGGITDLLIELDAQRYIRVERIATKGRPKETVSLLGIDK